MRVKDIIVSCILLFVFSCERTEVDAHQCGTCRTYVYQINTTNGDVKTNNQYEGTFCGDEYKSKLETIWLDSVFVLQIQKDCF